MALLRKGEKVILEEKDVWVGKKVVKGKATLTNQRVLFEGTLGGLFQKRTETILDVDLDDISNMQVTKGFMKGNTVVLEVPLEKMSSSFQQTLLQALGQGREAVPGQLQGFAFNVKNPDDWENKLQEARQNQ